MKKLLLTAVVAFSTLVASAQFMVVTTYDGDQEESMDKITANMGIGYMVNDAFTVGLAKGTVITAADALTSTAADTSDGYDLFVRYNIAQVEGAYASLQMPTKDASDNMSIGVGFAFNVWNGLYVEPNYTMPTKEDPVTKKREGTFNFGISYRF
jgi:hemolysin activation/secretion protein